MKKLISLALVLTLCLALAACSSQTADPDGATGSATSSETAAASYTVGICQLMQHDALDAATRGFRDAITEALGDALPLMSRTLKAIPAPAPPS